MADQRIPSHQIFMGKTGLFPQEEMLEVGKKQGKLIIGIPKESDKFENRVTLTPEAVELLVNNGHKVIIQSNAGKSANYFDKDYSENGGLIVENPASVYQADIVLKVAPMTLEEIDMMPGNQTIITSFFFNECTRTNIEKMMQKKITAIASEDIKDINNNHPVLRSMSEIAGNTSVLIAAEYLSNVNNGKGVMLGGITGITPTEVVILGAGTAGEYAARAALGLGAFVKVMDSSIQRLRELQITLGRRLYTSVLHPQVIEKALKSTDVLIGAMYINENKNNFFVTEEMVMGMKKGAVIVDISIDQGGCIETSERRTHGNPIFTKHGVIHYCVPNIPSRVARTASIALSNVFSPILISIGEAGGITHELKESPGLRHGVYLYNGILTNPYIGNKLGLPAKDIDLLMAAF